MRLISAHSFFSGNFRILPDQCVSDIVLAHVNHTQLRVWWILWIFPGFRRFAGGFRIIPHELTSVENTILIAELWTAEGRLAG